MVTKTQITTLAFSADGSPWVRINASELNAYHLIFSKDGSTWWGHSGGSIGIIISNVKRILKVDWSKVKKMNGVDMSNVKTIIEIKG